MMRDFKNYEVWRRSHALTLKIYEITNAYPSAAKNRLISQMLRASYSVPSNFAEGCGRLSDKDFNRFLQISLGSVHELEYFVILSKDLKYITNEVFEALLADINLIKKQLYSLSKKLQAP